MPFRCAPALSRAVASSRRRRQPAPHDRRRRATAPGRARPGRSAAGRPGSRRTRPRRPPPAPTAVPGSTPRRRSRTPLSAAAPTITGSATVRESRFAWRRSKRRSLAAVSVAPLRETPGISAAACPTPRASPSAAPASPAPRSWGARSAATIAAPSRRPARPRSTPGPPKRSSIWRSNRKPATAGGRKERATTAARRPSKERSSLAISRRWPISSAAAPPAWTATSKLLRASGSASCQLQPSSQGTRLRWAELETGSSSAGPWIRPSAAAWTGSRSPPAAGATALGPALGRLRARPPRAGGGSAARRCRR